MSPELVNQHIRHPPTCAVEGFDASRVEDLGGEVTAEGSPRGAVAGGADVMLVTVDDLTGSQGIGTVAEDGAVLNKGLVGEGSVGDEDGRKEADGEGNDGTVFGVKTKEKRLEFIERYTKK